MNYHPFPHCRIEPFIADYISISDGSTSSEDYQSEDDSLPPHRSQRNRRAQPVGLQILQTGYIHPAKRGVRTKSKERARNQRRKERKKRLAAGHTFQIQNSTTLPNDSLAGVILHDKPIDSPPDKLEIDKYITYLKKLDGKPFVPGDEIIIHNIMYSFAMFSAVRKITLAAKSPVARLSLRDKQSLEKTELLPFSDCVKLPMSIIPASERNTERIKFMITNMPGITRPPKNKIKTDILNMLKDYELYGNLKWNEFYFIGLKRTKKGWNATIEMPFSSAIVVNQNDYNLQNVKIKFSENFNIYNPHTRYYTKLKLKCTRMRALHNYYY